MRASALSIAIAIGLAAPASAQPTPCASCTQGDTLIDRFSLQPLRLIADKLAEAALADPVTKSQYAALLALRNQYPPLIRIGALDDEDLAAVAASLCHEESGSCASATTRTLLCLAERCAVDLPPRIADVADVSASCRQYNTRHRSPSYGLGFEWGTGWQRSQYPTDGRAWSLGIEGRQRLGRYLGATVRVDRIISLDAATDADHNGLDDMPTGPITRISTLAGPSFILDNTRFEETTRFLRLDLLAGYISTRSQADESGLAAGFDLAYQLAVFRVGARVVQGFGDARNATMLLAHVGIISGSVPAYRNAADCGTQSTSRSSRLALGLDIPLGGAGLNSTLGLLAPGVGAEVILRLTGKLDAVTHADLLVYPGYQRDRVIHQAVLAGVRVDLKRRHRSHEHFLAGLMGGYSAGSGVDTSSGPVVDFSFAWGAQGREGSADLRLHARFGVGPDNLEYRALFLSGAFELRLDPRRWRDRS